MTIFGTWAAICGHLPVREPKLTRFVRGTRLAFGNGDCMNPLEKAIQLYTEGDKLLAEADKLYAEGDKIYAEGYKLKAEGNKLYAEGDKLYAEGWKLVAEGYKLYDKGNKLYAEGKKLYAEGKKLWNSELIRLFGFVPDFMKDMTAYV